ncbi:hypothetical protein RB653_006625 [Dictyostelium firmibasis]|uniref:Uncharacterized protein n=1 Tax=Dictyostelium firmibasis TaxID=79012 RepID=A0AAN7TKI6_9MYCE
MNQQFNQLVKKYCNVSHTASNPSSNLLMGSSKAGSQSTTSSNTSSNSTTTITTVLSNDGDIKVTNKNPTTTTTTITSTPTITTTTTTTTTTTDKSDSFAITMYEKLLKNSFKNKLEDNVFVLYTAKHMDVEEISHHLGGESQRGNVVEIYPHIYRICSGKTVRIQSKKKDSDKLFLSVVNEKTSQILLLNFEKKSNSGLFKFKMDRVKKGEIIEIDAKKVKRLIIYGKETKDEYSQRRQLQFLYNESYSCIEKMNQKMIRKREKTEKLVGFISEAALKAVPTVSVSLGANFGGGEKKKEKVKNKSEDSKGENGEKSS